MSSENAGKSSVLITGGSKGIGFATAHKLAGAGYSVILTSRSLKRARSAAEKIIEKTGNPSVLGLDVKLDSLADISRFYGSLRASADQIDVLINNAGVITQEWTVSQDGHEMQFAVNYLAHFLLTNLILEDSSIDNPKRIVNVSSRVHDRLPIDIDDLDSRNIKYDRIGVYSRSKLAMIYFSEELAGRLDAERTTANSVHPGVIATDLLSDYYGRSLLMRRIRSPKGDAVAEGAGPLHYLATSPEISGVTGRFFHLTTQMIPQYPDSDKLVGSKLWERSSELCGVG